MKTNKTENLINTLDPNMERCIKCGEWVDKKKIKEAFGYIPKIRYCLKCLKIVNILKTHNRILLEIWRSIKTYFKFLCALCIKTESKN